MSISIASNRPLLVGLVHCPPGGQGISLRHRGMFPSGTNSYLIHNYNKSSSFSENREMCRRGPVVASASGEQKETRAVLFDMDGVLCNSETVSRKAGAETMKVLYNIDISPDEFIPFTGTGEANFLGGVARKFNVEKFDVETCKAKFFEIYLEKYAVSGSGIGYNGAKELVQSCRSAGLLTAVASSADLVKVHANLSAADIPLSMFDAIVSADAFENLKPSPDIFLAAAAKLGIPSANCVVIEDAVAGVTAARAADMRCIGVTTTLSHEDMIAASPDKIFATIEDISLQTILTLKDTRDQIAEPHISYIAEMNRGYIGSEVKVLLKTLTLVIGLSAILYLPTHHDTSSMQIYRMIVMPWSIQIGLSIFIGIGLPYWKNSIFKYGSTAALQRFLTRQISYTSLDRFPWINSAPLDLRDYEIVILKFWTSGCINCQNTQFRIQKMWGTYRSKGLLIIGIHSAKFRQERERSLVERSIKQKGITYPVVIDSEENELFKQFGVDGWPTFVTIKPCQEKVGGLGVSRAMVLSRYIGERSLNDLEDFLEDMYGARDLAVKLGNEAKPVEKANEDCVIKSPSCIDFDALTGRIFMSDTGNNRILVLNSQGQHLHAIGGPTAGYVDGLKPEFRSPRGIVYDPLSDCIFVCDTGNHSIRCIDMATKQVSTLCGNGNQGFDLIGGKVGMAQRLNSPYGIVIAGGNTLLVSMAGIHQIWSIDIHTRIAYSFSGIGKELNRNGGLSGNGLSVCYSQPQGLALNSPNTLVVADSESSSIRLLNVQTGGSKSLIGGDLWFEGNLFLFGDRDGSGTFSLLPNLRPLMEHPSDVAVCPGNPNRIFISDTYNGKIKLYDHEKNELSTVSDAFEAPEGICFMDATQLLVVDKASLKILDSSNGRISSVLISFDDSTKLCRLN